MVFDAISLAVMVLAAILEADINVLWSPEPNAWNVAFLELEDTGAATHNNILFSHTALEADVV